MTKKILIIPAALIMIISFAACGRYPESQSQKTEWNSSKSLKQEESQYTKADNKNNNFNSNTEKANSSKKSEGSKSYDPGAGSTASIDDLIKTIKDVGGSIDSLDDVSDEDLNVQSSQ